MATIDDLISGARGVLSARVVYGEPYEKDGMTFIPAASVRGGGGGGGGEEDARTGGGGGFGMTSRPVGAYRIQGDQVEWIPAIDTTRIIVFGQVVGIVALLVFRSIRRSRHRHR